MVVAFNVVWGVYAMVNRDTILTVQSAILLTYGCIMVAVKLYSDRLTRTTAVDKVSTSDNTPPTM